jgi:cellulose synthase/poly-beta-1,6-N-acetylglucosamine synthase-like glycosyltransferase
MPDATEPLPSIVVVVPTRDDEAVVEENLTALWEHLQTLDGAFDWQILVIDDASTDSTRALADRFAAAHSRTRVRSLDVPSGIGGVLRQAFGQQDADFIVMFDVSMTYSPDHVGRMATAACETGARVVVASAFMPGGEVHCASRSYALAKRLVNVLLGAVASGRLHTLTEPVRLYDAQFARALNLKSVGAEVHAEVIYKSQLLRAQILEIPATVDWDRRSSRRRSPAAAARSGVSSLVSAFMFRPFAFFIVPGFVLMVAGFIAKVLGAAPVRGDHIHLASDGVLVLAAGLILLGIVTLQAKRYHEEMFHLQTSALRALRGPSDRRS